MKITYECHNGDCSTLCPHGNGAGSGVAAVGSIFCTTLCKHWQKTTENYIECTCNENVIDDDKEEQK